MLLTKLGKILGFKATPIPPSLPDGVRIYAVGDIHGRLDLLERIKKAIVADIENNPVDEVIELYLGDYVDRGPDSKSVIDCLISPLDHNGTQICLTGNHEEVLLKFLSEPEVFWSWRKFGGMETLRSYGVSAELLSNVVDPSEIVEAFKNNMPTKHLTFFSSLSLMQEIGGYTFVHAGVKPGRTLDQQDKVNCLWIREPFLSHSGDFGTFVVHGHTTVDQIDIRTNRLNLDTGAYLTNRLSCGVIDSSGIRFLQTTRNGVVSFVRRDATQHQ